MNSFSIVIPAHNEEKCITNTLEHALSLKYSRKKFEIIIVENGSNDKTLNIAKSFSRKNVRVYSIKERGVSRARNFGATKARFEWLIFLDADTLLKADFLNELNAFLLKKGKEHIIGTTELVPSNRALNHLLWFGYHNLIHRIFNISSSIQIARRDIFNKIKYDERLNFTEDLKLNKEMMKYGKFFFVPTKNVITSTRRTEKVGNFNQILKWTAQSFMPYKAKIKRDYEVIR
jgi:glycosyltransferase involved in cell wall biosynthesis